MTNKIVHSCSYALAGKKTVLLEAWLGTCVGVALFDPEADVGGLIHLLLDRPTDLADIPFKPETYAASGLPLLIEALCAAGAAKERLIAHVAGGSLVAPISSRDLNLDIGGRTADEVLKILKHERIHISQVETGGYFSCRMILDPMGWHCSVTPFFPERKSPAIFARNHSLLSETDVRKAITNIKPIPQVALKVMRMLRDEEYDMADLDKEIRQDQVISGMVLSFANSIFIGLRQKVDSISRALTMLGEKRFLSLVLSAAIESIYPENVYGYSSCKGGLFRHALGTALIAQNLAHFTKRADPDVSYTAGLLHDIGKIVLDQHVASSAPDFYHSINESGVELLILEKEKFGFNHCEIGGILAERWSLADDLIEVIKKHHVPQTARIPRDLTMIVYLADLLMSRFGIGYDLERLNTDELAKNLRSLGLTSEQFPALVNLIPKDIFAPSE